MSVDQTTNSAPTGQLFVISGPSGVGKGTLVAAVIKALPEVALSVSATTRAPRLGDVAGETYHFFDDATFDELVAQDGFLEWAEVHGSRYGTLRREVQKALEAGTDLILEIDTQGQEQVIQKWPGAFSVFIAPPSFDTLQQRLCDRATEDDSAIEQRLSAARRELEAQGRYNVVVVNEDLDQATAHLIEVIRRQRATR